MWPLRLLLALCFATRTWAQDARLESLKASLTALRLHNANATLDTLPTGELTTAKHQLRDWVESQLPPPSQTEDPEALAKTLNAKLHPIATPVNEEGNYFGDIADIHLWHDSGYLILTTGVGIICQYDDSAYVYRNKDGHWIRIFAAEQADYTVGHYTPQNLSSVYIHQPSVDGKTTGVPFVMTLGNHWGCASAWHPIYYRVWRLDPTGARQLLNGSQMAYMRLAGFVQGSVGDLEPNHPSPVDVLLEYSRLSIDLGILIRQGVLHYRIEGDTVRRVAPVALSPRDFVDEWLTQPWPESAAWSESPRLESWHHRLQQKDGFVLYFQGDSKHCKQPDLWQVALASEDVKSKKHGTGPTHYFQVRWTPPYRFAVVAVSTEPSRACTQGDPEANAWRTLFNTQSWHNE